MMNCKHAARLVSESMDRKLSFGERASMRFHLFMCRLCSGYSRELDLLREAARRHARRMESEAGQPDDVVLSPQARERIRHAIENPET